tara:strand:- start:473 stop:1684 length:1212 start_codon:yes stop_codon:yes gene_type:complete
MIDDIRYIKIENNEIDSSNLILSYLEQNKIIFLENKDDFSKNIFKSIEINGPAIILKSSGSTNKPKNCVHTISNLNNSANSSGLWLKEQNFNLNQCYIFNLLPLNHISGFMPLWRSKVWDCEYINIPPKLLKSTKDLFELTISLNIIGKKELITSLVPTQLYRLLEDKYGLNWLKIFDLIWVGGAHLSNSLFEKCINERINLAPCYGTTETTAMVSSLKPSEFLKGFKNYGKILKDIKANINNEGLIEIKSERIGLELKNNSILKSFKNNQGWWVSSDYGEIIEINKIQYLNIIGRKDNAFNSGGEIIYPDIIRKRIIDFIIDYRLPIKNIFIKKINDKVWGNKYDLLVMFKRNIFNKDIKKSINLLKNFSTFWPRHERPNNFEIFDKSKNYDLLKNNWKDEI